MGKAIKHSFWGAFMQMAFQHPRGYGAQNTVMHRLLSLGHCASFTKLLELPITGAHACLHYTLSFSPSQLNVNLVIILSSNKKQ